jgi:hypothetical protein
MVVFLSPRMEEKFDIWGRKVKGIHSVQKAV